MISRSTDTDWERARERAPDVARAAQAAWSAPALFFAERGEMHSTSASFSRRGEERVEWRSRWRGTRTEVIGDSDRRFAWTHSLDDAALRTVARGEGRPGPLHAFPSEAATGADEDVALASRMVDAASGSGRFRLVEAEIRRFGRRVLVCRSCGTPVERLESSLRWRLRLLASGALDYDEWTGVGGLEHPERAAVERAETALARRGSLRPEAGTLTVALAPEAAAVWLHEVVGHALEADYAERGGTAPLSAEGPGISVWTLPLFPGSCDDEGNAERLLRLVPPGPEQALITDERHASRAGIPRSGNGRRQDFRYPVRPRIGALRAERATSGMEIEDGQASLWIESVLAGHVDPERDEFVLEVGRARRGGTDPAPVGRFRLRGRTSGALGALAAVGPGHAAERGWFRRLCVKDGQVVETTNSCPAVVLTGLEILAG